MATDLRARAGRAARFARWRVAELLGRGADVDRLGEVRARALAAHVPPGGVGAEIGVHKGRFTAHLLEHLRPRRLHLIDPWYLASAEWDWGTGDRSTANALAAIIRRYGADLAARRVVLHVGFDLEVLEGFDDGTFDWVYLDTTHQYEQTVAELALLQRKLKADGYLCGDDWRSDPSHRHHGVHRAVTELVGTGSHELLYGSDDDQQWVLRRRS